MPRNVAMVFFGAAVATDKIQILKAETHEAGFLGLYSRSPVKE